MKTYHDIATDGGSDVIGQVTAQRARLNDRLATVRHTVAVMSGKGGVGKSSLALNLALAAAQSGLAVGLLDADLNGASLAKMTGTGGTPLHMGEDGFLPAKGPLGLKVMSIDLLLPGSGEPLMWDAPTQRDAYAWRGLMEAGALREFVADTQWGALDALFIDLPPGTDKLPNLVDVLPQLSGAVIVTIPSGVSQFVVGKSIKMATTLLETPVLGLVENMASYVCSCCGHEEALFPGGNTEALAATYGVPFLGRIPFDPRMARCADDGLPYVAQHPDAPATQALQVLAKQVMATLNETTTETLPSR